MASQQRRPGSSASARCQRAGPAGGTAEYNYGPGGPGFPDREGISVFCEGHGGHVFHTYSTYARGIDMMNAAYQYLDLVPKGRGEAGHDDPQYWVRRHDEYQS